MATKQVRNLTSAQALFKKHLEDMGNGGIHLRDILDDFLFMASTALRQAVHVFKHRAFDNDLESSLLVLKERYEVPNDFGQAMGAMVLGLEIEPHDFLGQFYGAIDAMNEKTGQFFTPDAVSEMMARMAFTRDNYEACIATGKRYAISEPCVGAGGMVIQAAKLLREWGAHPSTWYVDCTDIDLRCCRMAYIQFTLLHIPAIVRHGDTIRLTQHDAWETMALALNPISPPIKPVTSALQRRVPSIRSNPQPRV